eukprot:668363-Hanusia_phi.AAC.3
MLQLLEGTRDGRGRHNFSLDRSPGFDRCHSQTLSIHRHADLKLSRGRERVVEDDEEGSPCSRGGG